MRAPAPPGRRRAGARDGRPEGAPAERASSAGSSVRPAATITAIPSASTGPMPGVARKSASASTSIAATTVAPAERIAGRGPLGRARHRRRRVAVPQLLAVARDEQQAVVGPRPEHQHDQDRRRLAGHLERAGLDQAVDRPRRDQVGEADDDERHERHHRRPVGHEQQHEHEHERDREQHLVDPLERLAGVGREARLAGHERAQAVGAAVREPLAQRRTSRRRRSCPRSWWRP